MTKHSVILASIVCMAAVFSVAALAEDAGAGKGKWALEELKVVEGLKIPECLLVSPEEDLVYVSNIQTDTEGYWEDDGKGFLSRLTPKGDVKKLQWLASTEKKPLNAPKGMCLLKGDLFFADNARLMRVQIDDLSSLKQISLPKPDHINDLATDGAFVYASDTVKGVIYKVNPETEAYEILKAPASVNGITFANGKMFVVSWDLHEVFEMDSTGKKEPKPFGLAEHFTNPDGIELLDDGTFIVSDFVGNKLCAITPDRKSVYTLAELKSPADIGLDRKRGLLYVPQFLESKAVVYKLKKD